MVFLTQKENIVIFDCRVYSIVRNLHKRFSSLIPCLSFGQKFSANGSSNIYIVAFVADVLFEATFLTVDPYMWLVHFGFLEFWLQWTNLSNYRVELKYNSHFTGIFQALLETQCPVNKLQSK